jgi:hypothetical protein
MMQIKTKMKIPEGLTETEYRKLIAKWDKDLQLRHSHGYNFRSYSEEYVAMRDKTTAGASNHD